VKLKETRNRQGWGKKGYLKVLIKLKEYVSRRGGRSNIKGREKGEEKRRYKERGQGRVRSNDMRRDQRGNGGIRGIQKGKRKWINKKKKKLQQKEGKDQVST